MSEKFLVTKMFLHNVSKNVKVGIEIEICKQCKSVKTKL